MLFQQGFVPIQNRRGQRGNWALIERPRLLNIGRFAAAGDRPRGRCDRASVMREGSVKIGGSESETLDCQARIVKRSGSGDNHGRESRMAPQGLKDFAGSKAPKFGHFIVEFATPGIGHILKSAGCDFVLFDLEHSGFGFEAADLPVIIRAPSKDYHHIARAMDMGAEGLMLPMVGSAAEARHILNSMKYTPEGGRGVALQVSHDRYRPGAVAEKFAAANRRSTLFCQIETAEGVKNADAIAALPGVDCLWVGHFDLSVSLGVPGQFKSKKFTDAIKRVVAAARKHGKSLGRLVPTVQQGIDYNAHGFDFICYSGDVWVLHDALADAINKLRAGCATRRGGKKS